MVRFPYTGFQIEEIVKTPKHPRGWEPIKFEKAAKSKDSRRADIQLVREDGRTDQIRLVIQGQIEKPESYRAVLLLENVPIRGVDHHDIERRRFYKEVIPKGWHQDIINPNIDPADWQNHHRREPLDNFNPTELNNFLSLVAGLWNIVLPEKNEFLL